MSFWQKLAEDRIRQAQEEGVFDNLPGKGKPLVFENERFVREELRLTFKILKNAGCLPIEMELRREIFSLRQLLNAAIGPEPRRKIRRELNLLILNLNLRRKGQAKLDLPQL